MPSNPGSETQGQAPTRFRTPRAPDPIEPYALSHPAVPADLDGLTILQLTDLHVRTPQARNRAFRRLLNAVHWAEPDLIALTGDFMTEPGDEPAALDALERLAGAWRARFGVFGLFGNHDSATFMAAARQMEGITWLENRAIDLDLDRGRRLRLVGASFPEDLLGAMLGAEGQRHSANGIRSEGDSTSGSDALAGGRLPLAESDSAPPFALVLSHYPTEIFPAAELGLPLMLAGHTHGGQIRPWRGHVPHTSSDFPSHLATGILRLRNTVCAVSRGVGEAFVGLRINCPRQAPLYTLRRGPIVGESRRGSGEYATLTQVEAW